MTPILGPAQVSRASATLWAKKHGAPNWYARDAFEDYFYICREYGVRPEVAIVQSCHETGWGTYPGVVPQSYNNFCGLKTTSGGGNYDPLAHAQFPDRRTGITAHIQHLYLYAMGQVTWTRVVDPRHFESLAGQYPTVEALSYQWAKPGGEGYKKAMLSKLGELLMSTERCPFAEWRPLPEHNSQPLIIPRMGIAHSIVGSAQGAYNYFRDNTSLESHFIIPKSGALWQLMHLNRSADANYLANRFELDGKWYGAISWETEDNGDPDNDPWTDAQIATQIKLMNWLADTFGWPRELCASWTSPGFGYHTLYPKPYWSNVIKSCPGRIRIEQFKNEIMPAVMGVASLPQEEEGMDYCSMLEVMLKHVKGRELNREENGIVAWWSDVLAKKAPQERYGAYVWVLNNEPAYKWA